ncbi:MAG: Plug domain-containing protein [bacterium]|nr:Plug domain-containing protein [bacterium]
MIRKILLNLLFLQLLFVSSMAGQEMPDQKKIDKYFKLSLKELMKVQVSIASKTKEDIGEAPGIVSVITAKEIANMGAGDLRDILRTVPGFELGMRDLGYTKIGVRGIITPNSEKVKILVDDVPVNEHLEGSGSVVFGEFPVDDIERVEIIRSPRRGHRRSLSVYV